jgi:hypothetical protein
MLGTGRVLNFSVSEWILVGFILLIVVASPRVGRVGEILAAGFTQGKPPAKGEGGDEGKGGEEGGEEGEGEHGSDGGAA